MKGPGAIKKFFEQSHPGPYCDSARTVTMAELKSLSVEERKELGSLACVELGEVYEAS